MIKHTKINLDIGVKVYLREKKGYFYEKIESLCKLAFDRE